MKRTLFTSKFINHLFDWEILNLNNICFCCLCETKEIKDQILMLPVLKPPLTHKHIHQLVYLWQFNISFSSWRYIVFTCKTNLTTVTLLAAKGYHSLIYSLKTLWMTVYYSVKWSHWWRNMILLISFFYKNTNFEISV